LGLNISYSIVTNHQGQIKVTSEKGRTVFQVRLPVDYVSF
jgi:nitrogen-specific signal transduction histidine kinase